MSDRACVGEVHIEELDSIRGEERDNYVKRRGWLSGRALPAKACAKCRSIEISRDKLICATRLLLCVFAKFKIASKLLYIRACAYTCCIGLIDMHDDKPLVLQSLFCKSPFRNFTHTAPIAAREHPAVEGHSQSIG